MRLTDVTRASERWCPKREARPRGDRHRHGVRTVADRRRLLRALVEDVFSHWMTPAEVAPIVHAVVPRARHRRST